MKRKNNRRCLISKEVMHKDNLYRFIIENDVIKLDINNNLFGRGYYISKKYDWEKIEDFFIKKYKKNLQK